MPEWFIHAVATGGPATALIMTYMWWRAEKRAEKYETKWVNAHEQLPQKLLDHGEQNRKALDSLRRAIWASIKKGGRDQQRGVRVEES